jgi:hypothetical protein
LHPIIILFKKGIQKGKENNLTWSQTQDAVLDCPRNTIGPLSLYIQLFQLAWTLDDIMVKGSTSKMQNSLKNQVGMYPRAFLLNQSYTPWKGVHVFTSVRPLVKDYDMEERPKLTMSVCYLYAVICGCFMFIYGSLYVCV